MDGKGTYGTDSQKDHAVLYIFQINVIIQERLILRGLHTIMMFSCASLATLDILKMKRKRVTSITGFTKLTMLQCCATACAGVNKYVV